MYSRFVELVQKHNSSAYKVSKATGVSQQALSSWKVGRSVPNPSNLKKIADYFGVSVDYLMTGETKNTPSVVLTEGEQELLDLFRLVPPEDQKMVLGMIRLALGKQG